MISFDLTGKVAIVTGGNGGIGLGMARGLASAGASIVVAGRNAEKSRAAVANLEALGAAAAAIEADVRDEASVNALVAAAIERFGRVDILVNNAGTNIRKRPEELSLDDWHTIIDTNVTSAFMLSKAVHPHMKAQGGGKIINIASIMSLFGAPFTPAYATSKSGIVGLTRATAVSWGRDNIQVNAVLPGWIDTDLTRGTRIEVPDLYDRTMTRIALGRWGEGDDLAGIAVFLASQASDYITGSAIPVDGGYSVAG